MVNVFPKTAFLSCLVVALSIMMSACVPSVGHIKLSDLQKYEPPEGKGAVYFFRESSGSTWSDAGANPVITLNGIPHVDKDLYGGFYFMSDLLPGDYQIGTLQSDRFKASPSAFSIEAGETKFIQVVHTLETASDPDIINFVELDGVPFEKLSEMVYMWQEERQELTPKPLGSLVAQSQFIDAVKSCSTNKVISLLDKGEKVNQHWKTEYNKTPLILASELGCEGVVDVLVKRGAEINAVEDDSSTALMYAALNGHVDVARILVENKADVNVADEKGRTALMYAANSNAREIGAILISNGGSVNYVNENGDTALTFAAFNGNAEIGKLLVDHGADVNHSNNAEKSALMYALEKNIELAGYMKAKGKHKETSALRDSDGGSTAQDRIQDTELSFDFRLAPRPEGMSDVNSLLVRATRDIGRTRPEEMYVLVPTEGDYPLIRRNPFVFFNFVNSVDRDDITDFVFFQPYGPFRDEKMRWSDLEGYSIPYSVTKLDSFDRFEKKDEIISELQKIYDKYHEEYTRYLSDEFSFMLCPGPFIEKVVGYKRIPFKQKVGAYAIFTPVKSEEGINIASCRIPMKGEYDVENELVNFEIAFGSSKYAKSFLGVNMEDGGIEWVKTLAVGSHNFPTLSGASNINYAENRRSERIVKRVGVAKIPRGTAKPIFRAKWKMLEVKLNARPVSGIFGGYNLETAVSGIHVDRMTRSFIYVSPGGTEANVGYKDVLENPFE